MESPQAPAVSPLACWCEAHGISPRRLSLEAGFNQHLVGRIIRGERRPSEHTIARLAKVTGLAPETLRGGPAPVRGDLADRLRRWCAETGVSGAELARRAGRSERFKEVLTGKARFVDPALLERLELITGLSLQMYAVSASHVSTLADALAAVARAPGLSVARKVEIQRDLERFARGLQRPLEAIPATRESVLPPLQGNEAHRRFGIAIPYDKRLGKPNSKRWQNFRRNILRALELMGPARPGRPSRHLSPRWRRLFELARPLGKPAWAGVSRLARIADQHGIDPHAVDDRVVELLREDLAQDPRRVSRTEAANHEVLRNTVKRWNELADRLANQGWPQIRLKPPAHGGFRFGLSEEDLSPALRRELQHYRRWATGATIPTAKPASRYRRDSANLLHRSLRASTAEGHISALLLVAKTIVAAGMPVDRLTRIAQLVEPDAVQTTLEAIDARHEAGEGHHQVPADRSAYAHTVAARFYSVARHYVRPGSEALDELAFFVRQARPEGKRCGLTDRNLTRLRAFGDRKIRAFLRLPTEMVDAYAKARKRAGATTPALARLLMEAVALIVLRICPLRRANLGRLQWSRHFVRPGVRGETGWLIIPGCETKHGRAIERRISPERWAVLETYMREAQPLLRKSGDIGNDYLFPSPVRVGTHIGLDHLSQIIADVVRKRVDVAIHLHLIRHLMGWIILRQDPRALPVVSRVLDHANTRVTQQFYAELDADLASEMVDTMLDDIENGSGEHRRRSRR